MTSADPAVSVIIPTLGLRERAASLRRAIESALGQAGVRATIIVVLNGRRRDAEVERSLRDDPRVRLLVRDGRGLPAAYLAGRQQVTTPFFTALDDDDFLLPGALQLRHRELEQRPNHAAVFTNGYMRNGAGDSLHMSAHHDVNADPVRAMLERNWSLPGSWLARTELVGNDVFEGMPSFLECTYLGLRIASEHPLFWIDTPTVVYHVCSPGAESRSRAYVLGQVQALRRIIRLHLPADVRRALRKRISCAYHSSSEHERSAGAQREAWRWHAASLIAPAGLRYLPYTRHLITDALRKLP